MCSMRMSSGIFFRWRLRGPGRKKQKSRLSYLACCNTDGSEKFLLMIIGKANKPRAFWGKTGKEHGFDYYNNKKAWMTSVLFFEWLVRFDAYIGQSVGRKALLLLDNASVHGKRETISELHNTEVVYLPPNTTSKIQPCDAGIIEALKMRYRKLQIHRALEFIDEADCVTEDVYKVDQLLSMKWTKQVWENFESDIIANCWEHTGIVSSNENRESPEAARNNVLEDEQESLRVLLNEVVPPRCRITIEDLVHPADEDDCVAVISDEDLIAQVVHDIDPDEEEHEDERSSISDEAPCSQYALKILGQAMKILDDKSLCPPAARAAIVCAQREIRTAHISTLRQTRIMDWFK